MFYSCFFVKHSFHRDHRGWRRKSRTWREDWGLRMCCKSQLLQCYRTKLLCQRKGKSVIWEQWLKYMKGHNVTQSWQTKKKKTFHAVCWEGFAKELTAEPKGAKCWKRWSSSGQVPALVPMAKLKLNLLSAPLKLVSQDSELSLSLPSITSAGTKGRLPKGARIRTVCVHIQAIKARQSPRWLSPFHCIATVIQMKCKMPQTGNYSVLQKGGEISKVKTLITVFRRIQGLFHGPARKKPSNIPLPVWVLSIKHLFSTLFMNRPAIVVRPPPLPPHPHLTTVQSIQLKYVTFHTQR